MGIAGCVEALGAKLELIEGIKKVFREFPRPNQSLDPPSISIITADSTLMPQMMTVVEETINENKTVSVLYNLGEYTANLQVDVWAKNKRQRTHFYGEVVNIFDEGIAKGNGPQFVLEIPDYHGVKAQYFLKNTRYLDNSDLSFKGEWRILCNVECRFNKVKETILPIITEITPVMDVS